jgi:alcohol dehydrogenase
VKALIYTGPQSLEWQERPDPRIAGAKEAIVRPIASTPCDLDRAIIAGRTPLFPPFEIGHECVAEVIEVGDGVSRTRVGDVVVVPWSIHCGECGRCRRGLTASCEAVPARAMYGTQLGGDFGGLFSEKVRVPYADAMLVPLPDGLDPTRVASASDNLTDTWIAASEIVKRGPIPVLVVGGAGGIGLYAVQAALAAGATRVLYVDRSEERMTIATTLGEPGQILAVPRDESRLPEHDVVIDASAHPTELARAIRAVAPGGICVSLGVYFMDVPFPMLDMYANDVAFRIGRPSVGPRIAEVLAMVEKGTWKPERVTQKVAGEDDAIDVLKSKAMKPVITRSRITR